MSEFTPKDYFERGFFEDFEKFQQSLNEKGTVCFLRNLNTSKRDFSYGDLVPLPSGDQLPPRDHLTHIPKARVAWFLVCIYWNSSRRKFNPANFPVMRGFLGSADEEVVPEAAICPDVLNGLNLKEKDIQTALAAFRPLFKQHLPRSG